MEKRLGHLGVVHLPYRDEAGLRWITMPLDFVLLTDRQTKLINLRWCAFIQICKSVLELRKCEARDSDCFDVHR